MPCGIGDPTQSRQAIYQTSHITSPDELFLCVFGYVMVCVCLYLDSIYVCTCIQLNVHECIHM